MYTYVICRPYIGISRSYVGPTSRVYVCACVDDYMLGCYMKVGVCKC